LRATLGHGAIPLEQSSRLVAVAEAVASVANALQGVGEAEPARLLDALLKQLHKRYLDTEQVPGEAGVELICRALAAIDIHLEDRLERDQTDGHMLAEASYAIDRLTSLLPPGEPSDDDSEMSDSQPWSEVSQTVNMEFLNLFLEEAQDELDNILTQHERWSIDTQDDVALSTLRRAFQTLKNSGSLVGARHLADIARVTGNLLDRLLDRELSVDASLRGYLTDVVTLLPAIIDAEAERRKPATEELMRRGKTLLETRRAPSEPAPSASHNVIALQKRPTNDASQAADRPADKPMQPGNAEPDKADAALAGLPEDRAGETTQAPTDAATTNRAPTPSMPDAWLDGMAKLSEEIGACSRGVGRQNIRLGLRLAQLQDHLKGIGTRINNPYQPSDNKPVRGGVAEDEAGSDASDQQRRLEQATALLGEAGKIIAAIAMMQGENATLLRRQVRNVEQLREGLTRGAASGDIRQDQQLPVHIGQAPAEARPSVLLLDHSPASRQIMEHLKGQGRIEVLTPGNGADIQAVLEQRMPDLLLLDRDMGDDMSGLELARRLRADDNSQRLPIIMLAASGADAACAEALAAGVDRVVAGPFSEDALLAEIQALLLGPTE
jgi:CheY-like chemotaxis protein